MADALRIERREYKYLVDEPTLTRLRDLIRPFCVLDPYAEAAPDHQYTIESLYLDSPDLATYQANFHEQLDRYKLRVRRYPDAPQSPYFLEVKRRVHEVQVKSRAMVGPDWADIVCDPFVARDRVPNANVERFVTRVHMIGARPTMVVRYKREAWMSVVDDYARVTFDREIRGHVADPERWSFISDRGWRACDDPTGQRQDATTRALTLLEMKFTTRVPTWMVGIVEQLGLWRQSFSKYGRLVEAFFLPPEERTPRYTGGLA